MRALIAPSSKQRATTISETIIRMLALHDQILEEKNFTSRRISVFDFFKSLSETRVLLDTGRDDTADPTAV